MSQNELSRTIWIDVDLIETLAASKLEAAAAELAQAEGLTFVTPIAATHVPYDLERQLHELHTPAPPLTEEETTRVLELSSENDALVAQLEHELSEGSAEAETAEAGVEAIGCEPETIEDARHDIDRALKAPSSDSSAWLTVPLCIRGRSAVFAYIEHPA
jgi:ParB family chromosome partitioning protein